MDTSGVGSIVGFVAAGVIAALAVCLAFARHAMRFFRESFTASPTFPDRLCAGIFITSAGTMLAGLATLTRILSGHFFVPLYLIGWAAMAAGYFFMFCAWHGALLARLWWFRWGWGLIIVVAGICAAEIFRLPANP